MSIQLGITVLPQGAGVSAPSEVANQRRRLAPACFRRLDQVRGGQGVYRRNFQTRLGQVRASGKAQGHADTQQFWRGVHRISILN